MTSFPSSPIFWPHVINILEFHIAKSLLIVYKQYRDIFLKQRMVSLMPLFSWKPKSSSVTSYFILFWILSFMIDIRLLVIWLMNSSVVFTIIIFIFFCYVIETAIFSIVFVIVHLNDNIRAKVGKWVYHFRYYLIRFYRKWTRFVKFGEWCYCSQ